MMTKEQLEKLLKHITKQFNDILGRPKFFSCWENTDRRWEEDDGKMDYHLSSNVSELSYVYLHFLYDPQTDVIQLIRSGCNVSDYVMWETGNASQLTRKSDYSELCSIFRSQMRLWYDCLIQIKMINDKAERDKKCFQNTMHDIAKCIFKYDV